MIKIQVSFVNIAAFMFSPMCYTLNNQDTDNVLASGQVTSMKGMLGYGDGFSKANMCWLKDTTVKVGGTVSDDHGQSRSSWDILILCTSKEFCLASVRTIQR